MSIATHIKTSMQTPTMVAQSYLADLSDEELFMRPAENANHIAWQLGHLIAAENSLINQVCPDSMPPLPEGFAEKYTKETAGVDDPSAFHKKADYLKLMEQQRAGTLAVLLTLSDEQLEQPSPEPLQRLGATVGAIFTAQSMHWTMHAGQWVILRRQLGKGPLF